ncbi:MAG TPA: hypothetical protein V6D06_17715, partial [Trichocoleus sp.]
ELENLAPERLPEPPAYYPQRRQPTLNELNSAPDTEVLLPPHQRQDAVSEDTAADPANRTIDGPALTPETTPEPEGAAPFGDPLVGPLGAAPETAPSASPVDTKDTKATTPVAMADLNNGNGEAGKDASLKQP